MSTSDLRFSDGVRHLYIPTINTISSTPVNGLRFWLANSNNFFIISSTNDCFEINFYDSNEILSHWASDINRLSCASIETVTNIKESSYNKKFLAWNLINYYYSSFYSAHSILKALSFGLIQIDSLIINNFKRINNAFGQALPSISSGMYCVNFNITRKTAIFYKVGRYDDSHRGLWQRFSDFLNVLSGISIVTGTYDAGCIAKRQLNDPYPLSVYPYLSKVDANSIIAKIDALKKILNSNGDFNWLSKVRNLVNYNHAYGVWFPYKSYQKQYDKVLALNNLYNDNPMSSNFDMTVENELIKFVKACQFINAINFDILNDLLNRHPENKSFLRSGFVAYNKLYK
jgi:hypothetical protein